jgi:hypothetical protein
MKNFVLISMSCLVCVMGIARAESPAQTPAPAAVTPAPVPAAAAPSGVFVKVEKVALGTAIENKEISGEAAQFPASVGKLYCWTQITTEKVPATIKHVWSVDGKKEADVSLEVKYAGMRTWSSKNVWPGAWKVEVVDESGAVLSSKEATVSQEPTQVGQ